MKDSIDGKGTFQQRGIYNGIYNGLHNSLYNENRNRALRNQSIA